MEKLIECRAWFKTVIVFHNFDYYGFFKTASLIDINKC